MAIRLGAASTSSGHRTGRVVNVVFGAALELRGQLPYRQRLTALAYATTRILSPD